MALIVITGIIIYLILILWTWQNLGDISKAKKIGIIVIGICILYVITLMIFQISSREINYESSEIQSSIRNTLVTIFAGIKGIIVMPQIGKIIDKVKQNDIKKQEIQKRITILLIIIVICFIFESGYMKDTQEGILKIYEAMK